MYARDYGNNRRPSRRQMRVREPLPRCNHCGSVDLIKDDTHGDMVCRDCATCFPDALTDDAFRCMLFEDYGALRGASESVGRRNIYSKDTYFHELLQLVCGRQNVSIPEHVLRVVLTERNHDITTAVGVRTVLRRFRMSGFYKHAWAISMHVRKILGIPVHVLNHVEEDLMKYMFARYHRLFLRIRGRRKNGLSYNYVMFQMFRLLNRNDIAEQIPLIRCRMRLLQHDHVWRDVCRQFKWEFIPVVMRPEGTEASQP